MAIAQCETGEINSTCYSNGPRKWGFLSNHPFFCGANDSVSHTQYRESKVSLTSKTRAALASHIQAADQPARAEDLTLCFNSATWIWMAEIITGQLPKIKQENPNICIYIYTYYQWLWTMLLCSSSLSCMLKSTIHWTMQSVKGQKRCKKAKWTAPSHTIHTYPYDGTFRLDLWAPQAEPSEFRRFAVRHSSPMSSLLFHVSQRWHSGCRRGGAFLQVETDKWEWSLFYSSVGTWRRAENWWTFP